MAGKEKKDYYAILGVDKTADDNAIKKAIRGQRKKYHPDKVEGDKTLSPPTKKKRLKLPMPK